MAIWYSSDDLGGTIGTDGDILFSRSTDNGATWSAPAALNANAASDSGWDTFPQLTTDGQGHWVAVWQSSENLGGGIGEDLDILFSASTDKGATWSAPAALNANAVSDSGDDWFPHVATDGEGTWVGAWQSDDDLGGTIGTDRDILFSRSTDNGETWTDAEALNTNAATDAGNDYHPELCTDRRGNWVATWYLNDIEFSRSVDNGVTWTAPVTLSGTGGEPRLATDGKGNWIMVSWYHGGLETGYALSSRSDDNGATWTSPKSLTVHPFGKHGSPTVATDRLGNWLAAWEYHPGLGGGPYGDDSDILLSRSTDNGATWVPLAPLNTTAVSDSGADELPQLATDGLGNWVGVWYSYGDPEGTLGTDADILVARFQLTGVIPTVSQWGLIVMAVLLIAAGASMCRRHVRRVG